MFQKATPQKNENEFDKYNEPDLHMERLMNTKLLEFDLSIRVLLPLESAGIRTLGDLTKRTKKELRTIPQLGRLSIQCLEKLLSELNLSLAK